MRYWLIVICVLFVAVPGMAADKNSAAELLIADIKEPYRGQAFVLSMSTAENTDYFSVNWQTVSLDVPADCDVISCGVEILLPTVYEDTGMFTLSVVAHLTDGAEVRAEHDVHVRDKEYPKESLNVDPKYVTPPKDYAERIAEERKIISSAMSTFSEKKMWNRAFTRPVPGAFSGVFGEQRLFNGVPKNKHSGLDFRGGVGEEIKCVADGKIILTGNFYYNGQFVFVDHGQGVITSYLHMSKIVAKQGDDVKAGDVLGLVGATGRVTGPHLHMGLHVQGISVDPEPMF